MSSGGLECVCWVWKDQAIGVMRKTVEEEGYSVYLLHAKGREAVKW